MLRAAARRALPAALVRGARPYTGHVPSSTLALVYDNHGHPSKALRLREVPLPPLGPDDVLVEMIASPVNPADLNMIEGTYPIRPGAFPAIGGNEGLGRVMRLGERVRESLATRYLTESNNGDAFSPDALAKGAPLHVVTAEPGCGTWRTHAVVPASKLRTLQRGTEPASVLPGANAHEPYLEELAQMSVNVQTAWRMLNDFATLTPTQATVVLNAPTSAVGRAAIQLCKHRGVDVVALLRPRPTHEAFAADANRLIELGASHVFADDGAAHRSVEARAQLANLPPVRLALNGVGGASCVNVSSMLAKDGVVVTYGGMSKQPVGVPTGSAIFKNVSARGFWLTRWLEDRRMEEETAVNTDPSVRPWAHGAFMAPPDSAYARGERAAMGNECERLIRAGALNLPTRRVGLEEACEVIGTGVSVGAGKTMIWMKE